jgi:hypothetical protein
MKLFVPIALCAAAGVVLLSWATLGSLRAAQAPPSHVAEAGSSATSERLLRRVEALDGELAELQSRVRRSEDVPSEPAPKPTGEHGAPPTAERKPFSLDQYHAFIAQRFADETRDASWREAAELAPKLTAILPAGSRLRALDCRTSLCRVETSHLDMERYREFLAAGFSLEQQIWSGAAQFPVPLAPQPNEPLVAVSWLMKGLPPVPPGFEHLAQQRSDTLTPKFPTSP